MQWIGGSGIKSEKLKVKSEKTVISVTFNLSPFTIKRFRGFPVKFATLLLS